MYIFKISMAFGCYVVEKTTSDRNGGGVTHTHTYIQSEKQREKDRKTERENVIVTQM